MSYKWKTKIPKVRQAISNIRFYLALESGISSDEKGKIMELVDILWKSILEEVDENKLEKVEI